MSTHLIYSALWLLFLILQFTWPPRQTSFASSIAHVHPSLKLHLQHIDFRTETHSTRTHMMQNAVSHSHQRLKLFKSMAKASLAAGSSAASTYETAVLAGQGTFLTTISTGTPALAFTAIVDTGSDLTWRQCQPCVFCYPQDSGTIFDPSLSTTYRKAVCDYPLCDALFDTACPAASSPCTYLYSYGDQSYTIGNLSYDTLSVPTSISADGTSGTITTIPNVAFGCGTDNENSNFAGAGGLLGLGQGPLSLVSQLSLSQFSYCLQSIPNSASKTSPLFLGVPPTASNASSISTPIISNPVMPSLYHVGMKGISVGGKMLAIDSSVFDLQTDGSGGTIIDSGTTLTYLAETAYIAVLAAFEAAISAPVADGSAIGLDLCYTEGGDGVQVPSLSLHLEGGGQLDLPADNYFISVDGLSCLALFNSGSLSILGNILQQNLHVVYDQSSLKLSVSHAVCDSL